MGSELFYELFDWFWEELHRSVGQVKIKMTTRPERSFKPHYAAAAAGYEQIGWKTPLMSSISAKFRPSLLFSWRCVERVFLYSVSGELTEPLDTGSLGGSGSLSPPATSRLRAGVSY